MYDNYNPFQELAPVEFDFYANNFEIWQEGKLIKKGQTNFSLICRTSQIQNTDRMVFILNETLGNEIKKEFIFDKIITSLDRLVLLALPKQSYHEQINMLIQMYESTRPMYTFQNNEPYTCSIFTKNGQISKLSFNIYNGKLIELY